MYFIINYFKLKKYIMELGFTSEEAITTIRDLRKTDADIRKSLYLWFDKGVMPQIDVENISFEELVTKVKLNEINAFLTLDWLRKEPLMAKKGLVRLSDCVIPINQRNEENNHLYEHLKQYNLEKEKEDTSDFIIEE